MRPPLKNFFDVYATPPSSLNQGVNEQPGKKLYQHHSRAGKLAFISGVLSLAGMVFFVGSLFTYGGPSELPLLLVLLSVGCMPVTIISVVIAFCQCGYPKLFPFLGMLCIVLTSSMILFIINRVLSYYFR